MRSFRTLVVIALVCGASRITAADLPPLTLRVQPPHVVVSAASSRGPVVIFSCSLDSKRGLLWQKTDARSLVTDSSGIIDFVPSWGVPFRSIWIAIDVNSGRYAVAGPPRYRLNILPFPSHLLKKDAEGGLGIYGMDVLTAEMVIVRPQVGAWTATGIADDTGDADHENDEKLSLSITAAIPVLGSTAEPPRRLKNGDVIAVIDTGVMAVFVTEIGK